MTRAHLQFTINELEQSNSKKEAYVGLFIFGGGPDESCIHANRQGLELLASQLLQASLHYDTCDPDSKMEAFFLETSEEWVDRDSHVFLQYVTPMSKAKKEGASNDNGGKGYVAIIGCFTVAALFLFLLLVGSITVLEWMT